MDAVRAAVADAVSGVPGRLYVGFSGGRDSTVLLHAVAALRTDGVVAVHVDHGLHPESSSWARHCEAVARGLSVGFVTRSVSVPRRGSLEARARSARYAVFEALLGEPHSTLFLAHHRDDQSETLLLRLLQGRGLYGMPQRRALAAGTLVRPLLGVEAACLARYARQQGLDWVEDPANADPAVDRNYLRHRVLPVLRRRWPDVDRVLSEAAEDRRRARARLTAPFGDLREADSLELAAVAALPAGERAALLRLWLECHGIEPPRQAALEELLRQVSGAAGDRQPQLRVGDVIIRRHGGVLYLTAPEPALEPCYAVAVPGVTRLPHGVLELTTDPCGFALFGALRARFRGGGERLRVGGHHRDLKHLLREAGVPPWRRDSYPLLFDDRGLAAVPGVAVRDAGHAPGQDRWQARWQPGRQA